MCLLLFLNSVNLQMSVYDRQKGKALYDYEILWKKQENLRSQH